MVEKSKAGLSRRGLLAAAGAAPSLLTSIALAQTPPSVPQAQTIAELKAAKGTKLVLLGTAGGPGPGRSRHSTSHLLLSEGAAYVLDCGLGVTNQYARTGVPFRTLKSIFITHHHPDHNLEYGPLLVTGWIGGLRDVTAFGPPPLKRMTEKFLEAYQETIDFWSTDMQIPPLRSVPVNEVFYSGPVMHDERVKVSCVLVEHPPVTPAFGYRFDFKDRSIAFSGDTVPLEAVAKMAKNADVLVHEAMYLPALEAEFKRLSERQPDFNFEAHRAHMKADHSPVEDVGRIAQEAGVKMLVLSHLTPVADSMSDDDWRSAAGKYFKGDIIVGKDLMVI